MVSCFTSGQENRMEQGISWRRFLKSGEIGRERYFWLGIALSLTKYSVDASVASLVFHRVWTPWNYLISGSTLYTLARLPEDQVFFLSLFAISIPFVAIGVALTLARLRSAGASPLLVFLFFLPVLNLITFLILVMLRPKPVGEELRVAMVTSSQLPGGILPYGTDQSPRAPGIMSRIFPESPGWSLIASASYTAVIQLLMTWISVQTFQSYGWGVFIALPFLSGLISTMLHGMGRRRTWKQCMAVATVTPVVIGIGVILAAMDGAICVLMYLPLAIPMSWIGGAVGYSLQRGLIRQGGAGNIIAGLILFMPLFMGAERIAHPQAPIFAVTTVVDIDAPPERVWNNVVTFSKIPPPTGWIFRAGVAYPVEARIDGTGVGAVRRCVFSTGTFVEPITVWDAPRLLKFDVTSNPPAMRELSPYDIHPPHVHDFLISHGGEFRLIPLPDRRTRVEGTTWYEHNLWPAAYWRLWSDYLIHRIHRRVLEHVKQLSEDPFR
jgi:hypothetical protein